MKKNLLSFLVISVLFFSNKHVHAFNNMHFSEEFTFSLDSSIWTSYLNNGNINFSNNEVILSDIDTKSFPYVTSNNNVFPQGNFSVEWKFKYHPYIGLDYNRGTGVAINDVLPLNGIDHEPITDELIFNTWYGGGGKTAIGTHLCEDITPDCEQKQRAIYLSNSVDINAYRTIKIDYVDSKYTVYYKYSNDTNFEKIFTSSATNERPNFIWLGSPLYNNDNHRWSDFSVDYIRITSLPDKYIDVPHYSQNDLRWKDVEYDKSSLSEWGTHSIGDWGCAMTSANMVIANFGYTLLTDGVTDLTPPNLNTYLSDHAGYANTYLKFPSISSMVSKIKQSDPIYTEYSDLELEYIPYDRARLISELGNKQPVILKLVTPTTQNTHFVVAKGYGQGKIIINDPLDINNTDAYLEDKYVDEDYVSMIIFKPSNTDLSYFWLTLYSGQNVTLELNGTKSGIDGNGSEYLDLPGVSFIDEGGIAGGAINQGSYKLLMLPEPTLGDYTLSVYGNAETQLNFDLATYKKDGSQNTHHIDEPIDQDGRNDYILNFSPDPSTYQSNLTKQIDIVPDPDPDPSDLFKALEEYIKNAYDQGKIKSKTYRNLLLLKVDLAQWLYNRGNLRACEAMLDFIEKSVAKSHKNQIDQSTANEIIILVQEIKESLGL